MAQVLVFPQTRVVRSLYWSPRVAELEFRILELLRILQHRNCQETIEEILLLRHQIWLLESEEAGCPHEPFIGDNRSNPW
jgi:hypothetical protein